MNPLARQFRDEAGYLHQAVAAVAAQVVFMAAGLPLVMKGAAQSVPSPQIPQP
jgi:adenosylcobinamide kinase/adenosylcobinamide-phosphate guanylyltransferase